MALDYAIYDVFTTTAFAGNPLAVVFDADALSTQQMQAIAKEFNLSETVFVVAPDKAAHTARFRIFTPARELPFAGHPTIGGVIALMAREAAAGNRLVIIEEKIGDVRCVVTHAEYAYAEFDAPKLPQQVDHSIDRDALAAALGLASLDLQFENHHTTVWTAGNAFAFIPLSGLDAMQRISVNSALLAGALPDLNGEPVEAFVYCRETVSAGTQFHARMFAPHMGIDEDPATGSAVAAFAGAIGLFDGFASGPNEYWIEQGMEMGRPSRIRLEVTAQGGVMQAVRLGGNAVQVAEGQLYV